MKRLRLSDPKEVARESKSRFTGSAFLYHGQVDNGPRSNQRPALKVRLARQMASDGTEFSQRRGSFFGA